MRLNPILQKLDFYLPGVLRPAAHREGEETACETSGDRRTHSFEEEEKKSKTFFWHARREDVAAPSVTQLLSEVREGKEVWSREGDVLWREITNQKESSLKKTTRGR